MGVSCTPKCGNCKCGNCPLGAADFSIKDQKEIEMIDKGLKLEDGVWTATYPWVNDHKYLPNNKPFAEKFLIGTEKGLLKNPEHAKVYQEQTQYMLDRQVARKLDRNDLNYDGPVHYITHHEVLKEESSTTPCRIVFNASANYCGHSLNDYWAKAPDLLNNLMGILIKFRKEEVGYIGDIRKMYHTVRITMPDQQTHRFLWRDLNPEKKPEEYMMEVVSFGTNLQLQSFSWLCGKPQAWQQMKSRSKSSNLYVNVYG